MSWKPLAKTFPKTFSIGHGYRSGGHRLFFLHVGALASLSLAQPIFDFLSQHPQFLVAHHASPIEMVLLVVLLSLLIPGSMVAAACALDRIKGMKGWFEGPAIGLLVFLLCLLVLKTVNGLPGIFVFGTAAPLAWLSCRVYRRYRTARLYLTFLSPAILVVPAMFLTQPSIQRIITPGKPQGIALASGHTDTPIVMVVFDELPLQSLLDRRGEIDSVRFPNVAGLAGRATWYRHATTVSYTTQYALPAMLTGNLPKAEHTILPTLAGYPDNLFTWLRTSHRLNVSESITHLCPDCPGSRPAYFPRVFQLLAELSAVYLHLVLPENLTAGLPDIRHGWTVPNRHKWKLGHPIRQFEAFLEKLPEEGKPGLNFVHVQIPHVPWVYLPSGKRYLSGGDMNLFTKRDIWTRDETLVTLAFQRHLLQVGLVDRLLGRLVRKLEAADLFDRSLMIVVADHGVSFQPGESRRKITETNYKDILAVPLIIKAPYQNQGRIVDRPTRTTDIFPSIAGILKIPSPWPTDGISVTETATLENRDLSSASLITVPPTTFLHHRTTVCLEGRAFEVIQDGAWTHLERVRESRDKILFSGWAANMETLELANSILVFVNDQLVYQGMIRQARPDVAEYFKTAALVNSGFYLELDRELFEGTPNVRCFAVIGDRIREVEYPASFSWSVESESSGKETQPSDFDRLCSTHQTGGNSFLITRSLSPETLRGISGPSEFARSLRQLAWDGGKDILFKMGPSDALIGKRLDQLSVIEQGDLRIELDEPRLYESVQLESHFIPAAIEGRISARDVGFVAVALNGTIRAVAPTFEDLAGQRRFQAIVPESSFLEGANSVRVFAVAQMEDKVELHSSGRRSAPVGSGYPTAKPRHPPPETGESSRGFRVR